MCESLRGAGWLSAGAIEVRQDVPRIMPSRETDACLQSCRFFNRAAGRQLAVGSVEDDNGILCAIEAGAVAQDLADISGTRFGLQGVKG